MLPESLYNQINHRFLVFIAAIYDILVVFAEIFTQKKRQFNTMEDGRLLTEACNYRYICLLYQPMQQKTTVGRRATVDNIRWKPHRKTEESQCASTV